MSAAEMRPLCFYIEPLVSEICSSTSCSYICLLPWLNRNALAESYRRRYPDPITATSSMRRKPFAACPMLSLPTWNAAEIFYKQI
ncbi:Uncharacterized protein APZ42_007817 [Daphnia magna]|uniref:Uncharacterized protein n=1 Tax=Daphnia magna TaxID=35525 RepID=A0A164F2H9_9CRUS|nr:Uncharacterized protein APZ42_007817 [Daphnia magna]